MYSYFSQRRSSVKFPKMLVLLAASVLLIGAVAACGDDDDEEDVDEPAVTTAAATDEPADETPEDTPGVTDGADDTPGATGLDDEVQVDMADFSFSPNNFSVPADVPTKIEASNVGAFPHTLTVYTDEEFSDEVDGADTGTISAGEDGDFTVTFQGGEYYFRCEVHPGQMQGELTAE